MVYAPRPSVLRPRLLLASLLLLVAGVAAAAPPRILTWEEMMPPGEEEILLEIYDNYIASLAPPVSELGGVGPMAEGSLLGGIAEGSPEDQMVQLGTFNVVPELDGQSVRLPGWAVPLDLEGGQARSFLLVPYFGACIHVPPPPPNQIVFVQAAEPVELGNGVDPIWVEGVLSTGKYENGLGDAAYSLQLAKLEPFRGPLPSETADPGAAPAP